MQHLGKSQLGKLGRHVTAIFRGCSSYGNGNENATNILLQSSEIRARIYLMNNDYRLSRLDQRISYNWTTGVLEWSVF